MTWVNEEHWHILSHIPFSNVVLHGITELYINTTVKKSDWHVIAGHIMVAGEIIIPTRQEIQIQTDRMCVLIKELAKNVEITKAESISAGLSIEQLDDLINQNINSLAILMQSEAPLNTIQTAYNLLKQTLEFFKTSTQASDNPDHKLSIALIEKLLQGQPRAVEFYCVGLPEYDEIFAYIESQMRSADENVT